MVLPFGRVATRLAGLRRCVALVVLAGCLASCGPKSGPPEASGASGPPPVPPSSVASAQPTSGSEITDSVTVPDKLTCRILGIGQMARFLGAPIARFNVEETPSVPMSVCYWISADNTRVGWLSLACMPAAEPSFQTLMNGATVLRTAKHGGYMVNGKNSRVFVRTPNGCLLDLAGPPNDEQLLGSTLDAAFEVVQARDLKVP